MNPPEPLIDGKVVWKFEHANCGHYVGKFYPTRSAGRACGRDFGDGRTAELGFEDHDGQLG